MKTVKVGTTVKLLAGVANPVMVTWTIAKVGKLNVVLTAAGRPDQKVPTSMVAGFQAIQAKGK